MGEGVKLLAVLKSDYLRFLCGYYKVEHSIAFVCITDATDIHCCSESSWITERIVHYKVYIIHYKHCTPNKGVKPRIHPLLSHNSMNKTATVKIQTLFSSTLHGESREGEHS